jgi:hypothetical protein
MIGYCAIEAARNHAADGCRPWPIDAKLPSRYTFAKSKGVYETIGGDARL